MIKILVAIAIIVGIYVLGWQGGDKVSAAIAALARDLLAKFLALFKKK